MRRSETLDEGVGGWDSGPMMAPKKKGRWSELNIAKIRLRPLLLSTVTQSIENHMLSHLKQVEISTSTKQYNCRYTGDIETISAVNVLFPSPSWRLRNKLTCRSFFEIIFLSYIL